jgi:hypothetical protein
MMKDIAITARIKRILLYTNSLLKGMPSPNNACLPTDTFMICARRPFEKTGIVAGADVEKTAINRQQTHNLLIFHI